MYAEQSGLKQLAVSQVSIVLFSLAAGLLGRGTATFWLFVLAYFIIFGYVYYKLSRPKLGSKDVAEAMEKARVLYKEEDTMQFMREDKEYMSEMSQQMRFAQLNMLMMFPILLYFMVAYRHVIEGVSSLFENQRLGLVVAYLVLFEGSFALSRLGSWAIERHMRKTGFKPVYISVPRSYRVTVEGIVTYGLASRQALPFPLQGFRLVCNPHRKFVDLVKEGRKGVTKVRLYARNPEKLCEILRKRVE